jgi:twinkle protein
MDKERFFEWDLIEVKGSHTGVKKSTCPICSHTRKNKKDTCLYTNFDSGTAKCFHCDRLSFRDSDNSHTKKNYELPSQEWNNYTALSDGLVKWSENERKIKQGTLMHFGVTEEKQYIPQVGKEQNCIVFNYFEGGKVVNKKYRDGRKNFTQSKGGKPMFYNINSVVGAKKVYIVEGEFDVLAMHEAGVKSCISLPSGANDNDDYWLNSKDYLTEAEEYVIAVDNDEKGIQIREKIAHRLGKFRCSYIEWKGKDANDEWIDGNIFESLKREIKFPVTGTFNAVDLSTQIDDLYDKGIPNTIAPTKRAFGNLKQQFSTMSGQLTVVTGIPSHGKSNFIEWYVLNLIDECDTKASFFSPEHHPLELHYANFAQKAVGKPFFGAVDGFERMTPDDRDRFKSWSKERLYLTTGSANESVDWDWLLEKFQEQIFTFGINCFVIDAWNKVRMPKGYSGKDGIDEVLTRLTAFCQQNDVQVFLVAHPTKMKKNETTSKYEAPDLYSVSGSADFRNQTHNGFTIYRDFGNEVEQGYTEFINLKTKMSFQGQIGARIKFIYHVPTARYYAEGCAPYAFDLTESGEKQPIDYTEKESNLNLSENDEFEFEGKSEIAPF